MRREIYCLDIKSIQSQPAPAGVGILLFWSDGSASAANLRVEVKSLLKESSLNGSRHGYAHVESWALIPGFIHEP